MRRSRLFSKGGLPLAGRAQDGRVGGIINCIQSTRISRAQPAHRVQYCPSVPSFPLTIKHVKGDRLIRFAPKLPLFLGLLAASLLAACAAPTTLPGQFDTAVAGTV